MAGAASIFISATSIDLHSARDMVAKVLTSMGYDPVWQDIAPTDAGNLTEVLGSWIRPCAAVIQLVGFRYGVEPRQPDPQFGRVSYTQFEALYAEQVKKKVIYIFLPADFPTDACEHESEEKANLQAAYRQRLQESDVLRHSAASPLELENRVLRIRDELALLRAEMEKGRRRMLMVAALAFVILLAIGYGVWRLRQSAGKQEKTLTVQQHSLTDLVASTDKQKEQMARVETKVDHIRSLAPSARAERLDDALASANANELFLLQQAGVGPREIETALAHKQAGSEDPVARLFFEQSKKDPRTVEWLRAVLRGGLDPNMTIPHPYFERQAILVQALKAGNAPAVLALLDAGASPHPYQALWLTDQELPHFLFPYSHLMANERLDTGEKRQLAEAYRKAGAAITRFEPGVLHTKSLTGGLLEQVEEVEKVLSASETVFGFKLEETPPISQVLNPAILKGAGKETGQWTEFVHDMPIRITSERPPDFGPLWVEVRNLIGVYSDHAYFLGVAEDFVPQYALIEVSRDSALWSVYLCIGPRAGLGFAKGEDRSASYHSRAWRRFDLKYLPEKKEMILSDYYIYKATR